MTTPDQDGSPPDLLDAAILEPAVDGEDSEQDGPRTQAFAFWFSVAALSIAFGGLMVLAFDHFWVRPRLEEARGASPGREAMAAIGTGSVETGATSETESASALETSGEANRGSNDPIEAVYQWAAAWQERRIDDYLAAYAASFDPPGGRSRSEWAAERRARIGRQTNLRVTISDPEVTETSGNRRRVIFAQSYVSDSYRDRVRKSLWLTLEDDRWKIADERVIQTLPD